jgi:hypothetical protein
MNRGSRLAIFAVLLISAPCFAQFGGMGGMGGGMQQGGMGMGGMGMGRMRGSMIGAPMRAVERTVQVEMEGGQKIEGKLMVDALSVDSDLGQYQIRPGQVKIVRLSKAGAAAQPDMNGFLALEGSVTTTGEKEIKGKVLCPSWSLDLEFGTLTLDPKRVRTMTFSAPAVPRPGKPGPVSSGAPSRLDATLIEGPNAVALLVRGTKINRLAAASEPGADWVPVDLREPVEGQAVPIVGPGIVVYGLGRHVYAFSSETKKWDILDLPEGSQAVPIVGNGSARVDANGQIHEFSAKIGQWKHLDVRSILESAQDKIKKALEPPAPE